MALADGLRLGFCLCRGSLSLAFGLSLFADLGWVEPLGTKLLDCLCFGSCRYSTGGLFTFSIEGGVLKVSHKISKLFVALLGFCKGWMWNLPAKLGIFQHFFDRCRSKVNTS